jgi:hypothetical protein
MILLGQQLADMWIARQKAKGKQFPITDPALRYLFLIRASAGLWAVALTYVLFGGVERETSGRDAIGQWFLVTCAVFGWIPTLVFFIKRRRQLALQSGSTVRRNQDN